mmetsp:Transcript_163/g.352  ORF Transcript_163/g.352 Transcript_163/m.352 type:complete len:82 (+) Transcript_163:3394-3639(+)
MEGGTAKVSYSTKSAQKELTPQEQYAYHVTKAYTRRMMTVLSVQNAPRADTKMNKINPNANRVNRAKKQLDQDKQAVPIVP